MSQTPTALPCPFCGQGQDPPSFDYNGAGPPPCYGVVCGECGARGPLSLGDAHDDHDGAKRHAVEAWNKAPRRTTRRQPAVRRPTVEPLPDASTGIRAPAGYHYLVATGGRKIHLGHYSFDERDWEPLCKSPLPEVADRRGESWGAFDVRYGGRPPCAACLAKVQEPPPTDEPPWDDRQPAGKRPVIADAGA